MAFINWPKVNEDLQKACKQLSANIKSNLIEAREGAAIVWAIFGGHENRCRSETFCGQIGPTALFWLCKSSLSEIWSLESTSRDIHWDHGLHFGITPERKQQQCFHLLRIGWKRNSFSGCQRNQRKSFITLSTKHGEPWWADNGR